MYIILFLYDFSINLEKHINKKNLRKIYKDL